MHVSGGCWDMQSCLGLRAWFCGAMAFSRFDEDRDEAVCFCSFCMYFACTLPVLALFFRLLTSYNTRSRHPAADLPRPASCLAAAVSYLRPPSSVARMLWCQPSGGSASSPRRGTGLQACGAMLSLEY